MSTKYTEERASYLDYLKDAKYELFCNPTKPNLVFDYKEVGKNVAIELQDNTNEVIFSSHLFSITVSYKVKFKFFGTPNNVPIDPQLRVTINWNDIKYEKCSLYKDNKLVKCDKRTILKTVNIIKSSNNISIPLNFREELKYDETLNSVQRKMTMDSMNDKNRYNDLISNICKKYKTIPEKVVLDDEYNDKYVIFDHNVSHREDVKKLVRQYDQNSWAIDSGADRKDVEDTNDKIIKDLSKYGKGTLFYHLIQPDVNTIKEIKF